MNGSAVPARLSSGAVRQSARPGVRRRGRPARRARPAATVAAARRPCPAAGEPRRHRVPARRRVPARGRRRTGAKRGPRRAGRRGQGRPGAQRQPGGAGRRPARRRPPASGDRAGRGHRSAPPDPGAGGGDGPGPGYRRRHDRTTGRCAGARRSDHRPTHRRPGQPGSRRGCAERGQRAVELRCRGDRGQRPAPHLDVDDPDRRQRDPGGLPPGHQSVRGRRDRSRRHPGAIQRHARRRGDAFPGGGVRSGVPDPSRGGPHPGRRDRRPAATRPPAGDRTPGATPTGSPR